ncbi:MULTISPECIES: helix-turn-helix domain-containing protein [unclassified Micromonospora]|uniref:helix-turn-helix domain-containing protein n=1 Tax=unclassified Micromonospora TaxID=2617518 RepID=UPI003A86BBEA
MHERLGEQLTVDEIARAAMFSKFHFTRMFQRVTGVSPGRFLSALRLQRAKELLVSTSMSVVDISVSVGYNSVGTFSSRFSRSVGMSPTAFRQHAGYHSEVRADTDDVHLTDASLFCEVHPGNRDENTLTFVGLFPERVPEGRPVRCAVLRQSRHITFTHAPAGRWFLLAQSVTADRRPPGQPRDHADRPVAVATAGPIVIRPGKPISTELVLRPGRALDPPVLLEVRSHALSRRVEGPAQPAETYADAA